MGWAEVPGNRERVLVLSISYKVKESGSRYVCVRIFREKHFQSKFDGCEQPRLALIINLEIS